LATDRLAIPDSP